MDIDLPIRGLDRLSPLFAYLIIYLVILIFIRLVLWPLLLKLRSRGTIGKIIRFLIPVLMRLAIFGGLFLSFLWALSELGLAEGLYESFLDALPTIPPVWIIGGAVIVLLFSFLYVARRSFRQASKKS